MQVTITNLKEYQAKSGRNAGKSQWIAKLVSQEVTGSSIAGLGTSSSVKQTTYYYRVEELAGKAEELINTELALDVAAFDIQERAFLEDGKTPMDAQGNPICKEDGSPIMLKWLTPKA